jgi:hypothetical protein
VIEDTDLVIDGLHNAAGKRAKDASNRNEIESGYLSERGFNQLTENLIYAATAGGVLPSDALAALAKALGTLAAFTARREGRSFEEVLGASQSTVMSFARAAENCMNEDPKIE